MNSPTAPPGAASLDGEVLARLRSLAQDTDPGLFSEILSTFRDDLSRYIVSIRDALQQRDVASLKHHAHSMKGACLNTGALSLAGISARLEDAALTGNFALVPHLLPGLEGEVLRVQAHITQELMTAA